ncbi:MAG: hypothetical protein JXR96_27970 [Deltaproteobacteria bacterium]|nr:hypothetical protein [Deltaproteobacteria bacterium]
MGPLSLDARKAWPLAGLGLVLLWSPPALADIAVPWVQPLELMLPSLLGIVLIEAIVLHYALKIGCWFLLAYKKNVFTKRAPQRP